MTIRFLVKKSVPKKKSKTTGILATVYVRLKDGTMVDQTVKTPVLVNPLWWDAKREILSESACCGQKEIITVNEEILKVRMYLSSTYVIDKIGGKVMADWLKTKVSELYRKSGSSEEHLSETFRMFISDHSVSPSRKRQYQSLLRTLQRYEVYVRNSKNTSATHYIYIREINQDSLRHLWEFIRHEGDIYSLHPEYFTGIAVKAISQRSPNTVADLFKKLRAFFNWCESTGRIADSPLRNFRIESELYGTPIYLTPDEVNKVIKHNFNRSPHLARQRDVFVFQCNVGCRVGDLVRFRKTDVVNGEITYIPEKTKGDRVQSVTVPLNAIAKTIVNRYAEDGKSALLPFITPQKYNAAIKQVLEKAGITRMVVTLDPVTRSEKKVRICDIGSSHMARRTFAGNLYKKVKDPALVASLTGHKEGSKAFARYRAIDDDMKRELVGMLE